MEPSFGKHECISFGGYEKNYTSGINNSVKSSELLTAWLPGPVIYLALGETRETLFIYRDCGFLLA